MNLEGIINVSGKPGLFKVISRSSNNVIIESLIEKTEHSLTEMEFFFKATRNTNAQTNTLAKQLLIILRGMSDGSRD